MRRKQMPSFGDWDYFTDIPFSGECSSENDNPKTAEASRRRRGGGGGGTGEKRKNEERRKQQHRTSKAVDEDLYKISPELLYKKPKKKKGVVCDKLKRCLRLSCISWKS